MNTPTNLTHRQWLAGLAMQGMLASGHFTEADEEFSHEGPRPLVDNLDASIPAVEYAYIIADRMIEHDGKN